MLPLLELRRRVQQINIVGKNLTRKRVRITKNNQKIKRKRLRSDRFNSPFFRENENIRNPKNPLEKTREIEEDICDEYKEVEENCEPLDLNEIRSQPFIS